ncbi:MAG: DegT/DnrJ/EryC1/StrS family aminotransferase [Oculatellaceae cyanobacterium Prado106]|nr:DegT/DnrJ/EryC1/StrS family aminotransferase [Oculatellaceae cyanobacterium Prado106]
MNSIPAFDLTQQYKLIHEEVGRRTLEVLASGHYVNGSAVESFEQQFAAYLGTAACVGCNSGTDALYLALRSLNIGSGDEVITTPFTFMATGGMISAVGATPVFVDVDPQTYNLDLDQIEAAITDRTKAVIPVHLFGQPVDMTRVMAIAQSHQLWVIEDCAQAVGATWQGQKVGSMGHIGCFSFYPTKNLGACGDGGAVVTQDGAIADRIRVLRNHGQPQRYCSEVLGINSRLDAVQAAILSIKLGYLDAWNAQRQAIAHRYSEYLRHLPGIVAPQTLADREHVWHQYTIRVLSEAGESQNRRDAVRQKLQEQGVGSMVYYPIPLHLQPVYADLGYGSGHLPVAEQLGREVLSLPMFPELSQIQQDQVIYALKDSLL